MTDFYWPEKTFFHRGCQNGLGEAGRRGAMMAIFQFHPTYGALYFGIFLFFSPYSRGRIFGKRSPGDKTATLFTSLSLSVCVWRERAGSGRGTVFLRLTQIEFRGSIGTRCFWLWATVASSKLSCRAL